VLSRRSELTAPWCASCLDDRTRPDEPSPLPPRSAMPRLSDVVGLDLKMATVEHAVGDVSLELIGHNRTSGEFVCPQEA
jgi:hypothetical protein